MYDLNQRLTPSVQPARLFTLLPGPTRRRWSQWYSYQLSYRNNDDRAAGCVLLWEVTGGRQSYQVAIERDAGGMLRAHCTCADAIYRGEKVADHACKHVRGLLTLTTDGRGNGPLGFETFVGGWR